MGGWIRNFVGCCSFASYTLLHLRLLSLAPVNTVFQRQLYFTGIQALTVVSVLGLLFGAFVSMQTAALVGADSELTVRILDWTIVGELGPLMAAMIIVGRSCVAIASELALMRAHGETDALEMLHIHTVDYLVVPRIAALTLSVLALTVYFQVVAVAGGLAASAFFQDVSFAVQLTKFLEITSVGGMFAALAKSFAFGVAIASISCWTGLTVARSLTAVPVAVMNAVMQSLIAVFLIEAAFVYGRYVLIS